jgi:hypothetical protein
MLGSSLGTSVCFLLAADTKEAVFCEICFWSQKNDVLD